MNPYVHPVFFAKALKAYLRDRSRLRRWDDDRIRRYQDKRLRHLVDWAYHTVPMYRAKYRDAGVHPQDIHGVKDIGRLPLVSKEDFFAFYPDGLVSSKAKRKQLIEISTSGTTGKKLALYVDLFDVVVGLLAYLQALTEHGLNWRKDKLSIIGDFASHTAETGYIQRGIQAQTGTRFLFKNVQWLNTNDPPKQVMEELNRFQPDFVGGYAGMLGHLALLKEQGFGEDVSPRCIGSTGSVLDPSLRRFIGESFGASVFEVYGATESGPLAFECMEGCYHVYSDLVYLEVLGRDGQQVGTGEPSRLVVTKLYGGGTPIIRYVAVNDIIASRSKPCGCGVSGSLLQRIYGRDDLALYLPNGRVLLASSFSEIYSRVLYELKTTKLKETRVLQPSMTEVEVQVVIDPELCDVGASVDAILSLLQKGFEDKVGPGVEVRVREVREVKKGGPRIVSSVDTTQYRVREYI
ncbi:MAG: hypothetical protein V1726_00020 [Methanobacteriota archaeon]